MISCAESYRRDATTVLQANQLPTSPARALTRSMVRPRTRGLSPGLRGGEEPRRRASAAAFDGPCAGALRRGRPSLSALRVPWTPLAPPDQAAADGWRHSAARDPARRP